MIDHIAALIFNKDRELLLLRKKTPNNRKECILPGGKRRKWWADIKKRIIWGIRSRNW